MKKHGKCVPKHKPSKKHKKKRQATWLSAIGDTQ